MEEGDRGGLWTAKEEGTVCRSCILPLGKASTPGGRSQRPIHVCIPFSLATPHTHTTQIHARHTHNTHTPPTQIHTHHRDTHTHTHVHTVTQTQPILAHTCMCVPTREHIQATPAHMHVFAQIHHHPHACITIYESHALAHTAIYTHPQHTLTHHHACTHACSHTTQPPSHAPRAGHAAGVLSGLTAAMKHCTWGLRVCRCFFSMNFPVVYHRLPGVRCMCAQRPELVLLRIRELSLSSS